MDPRVALETAVEKLHQWDTPGWHRRGYLPHVDHPHLCQAVTFRLADALPREVLESWRIELAGHPVDQRPQRLRQCIAVYEDAGHGSCLLADPACAAIVRDQLRAGHDKTYDLISWVIMPNHVHAIVGPTANGQRLMLPRIIRIWKGASARGINRHCQRSGTLWQAEIFDRYIRDQAHLHAAVAYVRANPVQAGLCVTPQDWLWSSG